jgi:hypothetical protein
MFIDKEEEFSMNLSDLKNFLLPGVYDDFSFRFNTAVTNLEDFSYELKLNIKGGKKYISADLAMQGRDKFIAGCWSGLICTVDIDKSKSTGKSIEIDLKDLKTRRSVGNSNIVADSDGLGAYLDSYIKHIKTFHGGGSAITKTDFINLKSECGFKLAEIINNREIKIICTNKQEEQIKKEVSVCLKRDNLLKDEQKKRLIPKDKMKIMLGNSPDYLDMLLMRMVFEISSNINNYYSDINFS